MGKKEIDPDSFYERTNGFFEPMKEIKIKEKPVVKEEFKEEKKEVESKQVVSEYGSKFPSTYYENLRLMKKSGFLDQATREGLLPKTSRAGVVLALVVIGLIIGFGIYTFYYLATNDYFKPIDNSTCINTCPEIPSCPANTCNCPAPNLNVSIPTVNVNVNLVNSSS